MFPTTGRELRPYYSMAALALLAYTALSQIVQNICLLPYYLGYEAFFFSDWYYYLLDAIVFYPAGILVFCLMLRSFPTPRLVRGPKPDLWQVLSGAGVGLGVLYAASYVTQLLLAGTDTFDYAAEAIAEEPLFFSLLCSVLLAPIFEELIFRKLLLDRLLFLGDWSALLLSSLFFGLFHTNLYQFLYAAAVGMVLGYIRIMTGSMKWNILLHMFINLYCGVLVDYLPGYFWDLYEVIAIVSMVFAAGYLIRHKPWRNLYPGPTGLSPAEKVKACLTSPAFWICAALHLGLSVYYISL